MPKSLITSYSISRQIESFFTGTQLEFDSSGEHLFCALGSDVNKVSIQDGQVKAKIRSNNQEDSVIRFTLTSDDRLAIIAYHSGLIMKFNLLDDTIEREFKSIHNAPISILKTNPSNTHLATGSSDGTIKLWNLNNHYCSHNLKGINGVVSCIEFVTLGDEEYLLCAGGDDNIHIFNLNTSKRVKKLATHCSTVTGLAFDENGTLISVGRDKIAVVWDLSDPDDAQTFGRVLRTIPLYESVESVVILEQADISESDLFDKTEDRVIFTTLGEEGVIKFWDSKTGAMIVAQNNPPMSRDISPGKPCLQLTRRANHHQLCAVTSERDIFFYQLPDLSLIQQLQGHLDEILSACWFAGNKYIALSCNSSDLKVMQVETSKCQHLKGHSDIILCVKALPSDSYTLITSSKDCSILIRKFISESMESHVIYKAIGHTHSVHALGLLNTGTTFFSGGEDTTLKKWTSAALSVDGYADDDDRFGCDKPVTSLIANHTVKAHDERIDDIAISPNDELVATGSRDKSIKVFSVDGLNLLATLKGHRRGVYALQFSPADRVLMSAGDTTLRLWNLQDFTCIKTFQGHDCAILNCCFMSSGLQALSVSSDGNIKLWDCVTSECMRTFDAHSGNTWALALTHDDKQLVTGGRDERLIVWTDTTKQEEEERVSCLQSKIQHEQEYMNYINKRRWRRALSVAILMENPARTLSVLREILLDGARQKDEDSDGEANDDGISELERILTCKMSLDKLDFLIQCCVEWNSSAKNSCIAQQVFNIIIRHLTYDQLLKLPSMVSCSSQLKSLTEKSFNRFERLMQEATFVDFFVNSTRIQ